ncbi:MFS multidrug transporter, putative [Cordyceps militaris CM01]|uniref:MFS multidrug transporter, putative n=1 Tax=Cordyceps militaris (strain CM01) TaxID=983644 RepID=G3JJG2_CORMM|nr:MFS multidrug transporter, putative [Cordyceps militaris CM01]EGX92050.1 MFS multidrug transporter, putative [Cordyceps militaris CM01]
MAPIPKNPALEGAPPSDAEKQPSTAHRSTAETIPHWRLVIDQAGITPAVASFPYAGSGTASDPYLVRWLPCDPRDPMNFSLCKKSGITAVAAVATLAVTLVSSAYASGVSQIADEFRVSQEVALLGVSLFVLGFAVGPLLWAPLSELFGRQRLFAGSYAALTALNAGACGARSIAPLLVLRFLAGAFGSSPLTNAGGTIADMFPAAQRGLVMAAFSMAPFLGPVLGPIIGGFLGMRAGWRWVLGFLAAFSGLLWIVGCAVVPETYAPVLLRARAAALSKATGRVYVSSMDAARGPTSLAQSVRVALLRPWTLLFREPIVLLLSIYMAIVYGILYMLFAAFPIVYQVNRGWSQGVGGLAFLGLLVGMLAALGVIIPANSKYIRVQEQNDGVAPPEARLPMAIVGSIALPIGLFWFAWTNGSDIHWIVSIMAGAPFGFGMILVFLGSMNYLIDAYTLYAASVLAASSVLRSCLGAAFPLFTSYMYRALGIHWASSIPAFLALACLPFPIVFYKYGYKIRARCKFAAESADFMAKLRDDMARESQGSGEESSGPAPSGAVKENAASERGNRAA